jgi:hypothetical protein
MPTNVEVENMRYKDLIDDPSFPHWGRSIILETLRTGRDPVDTVNVLEVLAETAKEEAGDLLASRAVSPRNDRGEHLVDLF